MTLLLSPQPPAQRSGRADPAARSGTPPEGRLRLLIGDGDGDFRRALRASLASEPRVDVVGEADDGELALRLVRWLRPDVALLDEDMPSFGGVALARVLAHELPEVKVVIMTRSTRGRSR
jgi:DNA-binding NarL/FixJ family response regulator